MRPTDADVRTLLTAGLMAPSAENKHYLSFELEDESVRLHTTDAASWRDQPHRELLATLACGAVVENIVLKAAELGRSVEVQWHAPTEADPLVAVLRWADAAGQADELSRAIADRHTNRRFYSRAKLPASSLERISAAAGAVEGCRLIWLDTPARRSPALAAMRIAETERFRRRRLHHELFSSVRFERGWTKTTDEWLPPGTLEIEPPMRPAFTALRHWSLMRALHFIGGHLGLGLRAAYLPAALAPHLGLIAVRPTERHAEVKAGRALQRAWLAAAAEGLAFQPMAAATVLLRQRPGAGWVDAKAQKRIAALLDRSLDGVDGKPYMLFRLGKAKPPSMVTGRRPLDDYLGRRPGADSGGLSA